MHVSLERTELAAGYISIAEIQIFMNSNPLTAVSSPSLVPTAAMSSKYAGGVGPIVPDTPASLAFDGSVAGQYNTISLTSQLALTNAVVERSWIRAKLPGTSYILEDIYRIALWTRTDGCCTTDPIAQNVDLCLRRTAVTDPSDAASVLYRKRMYNTAPGLPVYYYPNSQFATQDLYISLERTFSPTTTSIQIVELEVYLKSNPTVNAILGYHFLGQESTLSPTYPGTAAVDGNTATFSHTNGAGGNPYWIIYFGSGYFRDIDRIVFVNRVGAESMVGAFLRIRTSTVMGYSPNVLDTSDVLWQEPVQVMSSTVIFGHSYRPVDVENSRWTRQIKMTAPSPAPASKFGKSVSMNQNESVLVVGSSEFASSNGAIWIYRRVGIVWVFQAGPLQAVGVDPGSYQGVSVDIFDTTIAVGAEFCSNQIGCTIMYEWDGVSTWYQKQILIGTGVSGSISGQGISVSIHGDTVAVGGYTDNNAIGATWIFVRNASGLYSQQGAKLVGSGNTGTSIQGFSVSLWGDTVAIGGHQDNSFFGAVWIFTRSGGVWSQQGGKIVPSGYIGSAPRFGFSVSLQRDTLVVGSQRENLGDVGAVYVYTRSGGVWTQHSRLVGSNPSENQYQGSSVHLWNDYLAVGATGVGAIGSVYVYKLTSSSWREVRRIVGQNSTGFVHQGRSVCVRNITTVFGGDIDNSTGAVWVVYRDPVEIN